MLCDHQIVTEHLLDYIDGKLSPQLRQEYESSLNHCKNCYEVHQQALALHQSAYAWQEQPVPAWHRTKYAAGHRANKHNGWLNWTALATSTLAIFMVVFQVQFTRSESGFQIAFGQSSSQHQINQIVEKKLKEYKKQQAVLLDARFVAEASKQTLANKLLMTEVLDKTRNERRDDLNFLVTGIQTQRYEDQQKVDKHLNYLAENQIENNQYINQLIQSTNFKKGDN
ncbi:anti-sigma factor family protein [Aliikangiella sp. IMCC44359]|uniref:anti-sigma factor family protein n=1 Tax=Aliikangiella sp. IMCC44359 TaxID=3459125 RepID=UPI00403B24E6